jgi:hypothetical protein
MKKQIDYDIIEESTLLNLSLTVQRRIKEGDWQAIGSVSQISKNNGGNCTFLQAIVKYS